MTVRLSSDVYDALFAEAAAAHPLECCGVLLGDRTGVRGIAAARNVHARPATRFEIDPQVLIDCHRAARSGGPEVIGYYHSHPGGDARPSATDEALSTRDGAVWAIIAGSCLTLWRAGAGGFTSLPYVVRGR